MRDRASEDDLWVGHSGATVSRRTVVCACGGVIRSETHAIWIERAVKRHRRTKTHRNWWARAEPEWHGSSAGW